MSSPSAEPGESIATTKVGSLRAADVKRDELKHEHDNTQRMIAKVVQNQVRPIVRGVTAAAIQSFPAWLQSRSRSPRLLGCVYDFPRRNAEADKRSKADGKIAANFKRSCSMMNSVELGINRGRRIKRS